MTTTKLVSLGLKETDGTPARACIHMATWFPWFCLLVKMLTGVDLRTRIVQAAGAGSKSAATHLDGTALDLRTRGLSKAKILMIVAIARAAGARATWFRDWAGNQHIHLVLDCPCPSRADYQIRAADRGRDGLAANGPDPHPAPDTIRNYTTGLAWLMTEIEGDDPMPTAQEVADAVLLSPMTANGKTAPMSQHLAECFVTVAALAGAAGKETARDKQISQQLAAILKEVKK